MKKIKYLILLAVISAVFGGISVYADGVEERPQFDDSTVLVIMKPQNTGIRLYSAQSVVNSAYAVFDELGITDIEQIAEITSESKGGISLFSVSSGSSAQSGKDVLKLTLPESGEEKVLQAVDVLNSSGTVEYAQPDYYYYLDSYTPDDTFYSGQYSLKKINAENVWNMDIKCSGVTVAVLDTGILTTHVDLDENLWTDNDGVTHGRDFTSETNNITDQFGHGTHVAGIISAETNNGAGVASLARDAKIAALKVFSAEVRGESVVANSSTSWIVKALEYVKEKQFPIANCSWGATTMKEGIITDEAVKEMFQSCSDTLFTVAAGNDGKDNDSQNYYPATFGLDNIITVAATDSDDKLAVFYESGKKTGESNYGKNSVPIAAPGNNIRSTLKGSSTSYGYMSGTSQAAPLVASAAAVIKARYPDMTPEKIKECILEGADSISTLEGKINGARRLNAYGALAYASGLYCTVTWKDDNGNVIDITEVPKSTIPSHDAPTKDSDENYDYIFTGWSPELVPAENDTVYTAQFQPISKAMPREPVRVLDKFAGEFSIELTRTDSDTILVSIVSNEDDTDDIPSLSAYVSEYNTDGELEKIQRIDFKNSIAEIKSDTDKQCRLFIWTDKQEPVISPINDMTDFWNNPSQ